MNVMITGATSFLGLTVVEELLKAGHLVTAIVRPASENRGKLLPHDRLQVYEIDMEKITDLTGAVSGADIFFHMAWDGVGSSGRQDTGIQKKNIAASVQALQTAAALGCRRFIFSGSQAEYGIHQKTITEETPCFPVSEYGKAKLEFSNQAKTLCKTLKIEYIHTRIFSVYGPGDHPWSLVNSCLSAWQAGTKMELGECTQKWNYLYIRDCALGLLALMEQGNGGIYNLASDDTRMLRSYIEEMYQVCGGNGSYEYGERLPNAEGPASLMPAIEKIKKHTGWIPRVSFSEGIHETLSCMQGKLI